MRYEILAGLPPYGPMYISVSQNGKEHYSDGFVVRFFNSDNTSWVANFERGWTRLSGVFELPAHGELLVIAGGNCYLMSPDQTEPRSFFGCNYHWALPAPDHRIVLADETGLTIVEPNGDYWHSEDIALDGFKKIEIESNIVTGLASCNIDEWMEFSYDINRKRLR